MKRDMDLVRLILIEVEKAPFDGQCREVVISGHTLEEASYHVLLLSEAGLIDAMDLLTGDGICASRVSHGLTHVISKFNFRNGRTS